jgi:hypothetical protein
VAESKPRPSREVRERFERPSRSQAESYVRIRRVIEDPKNTVRSKKE